MATLSSPTYYVSGSGGASAVIGYETSRNRVVRFSFKTGSSGATSISISVTAGTIQKGNGAEWTAIMDSNLPSTPPGIPGDCGSFWTAQREVG